MMLLIPSLHCFSLNCQSKLINWLLIDKKSSCFFVVSGMQWPAIDPRCPYNAALRFDHRIRASLPPIGTKNYHQRRRRRRSANGTRRARRSLHGRNGIESCPKFRIERRILKAKFRTSPANAKQFGSGVDRANANYVYEYDSTSNRWNRQNFKLGFPFCSSFFSLFLFFFNFWFGALFVFLFVLFIVMKFWNFSFMLFDLILSLA